MSLEADDPDVRARVLAAFVDAEPLSPRDVAVAADLPVPAARDVLSALVDAGELHRTEVRGVDIRQRKAAEDAEVDLERPIELFQRPAEALRDGTGVDTDPGGDSPDPVDRRLGRMDVPGASGMMRDWRRDAVRAAHEHLREEGPAEPAELRDVVYPAHEAGFDDAREWWAFVRPRLARLPGVTTTEAAWTVRD